VPGGSGAKFLLCLLSRRPRGAEEKKKSDVPTYLPFLRFFWEIFRFNFRNTFVVFLGSSCRETAKNAIKQNRWEKTKGFFFSTFSAKSF
jgi:hypothetical protein